MDRFIIEKNEYLDEEIKAYYHTGFYGSGHPDNPNFLYKLKNDYHHNWSRMQQKYAIDRLHEILKNDLPLIKQKLLAEELTICTVPRAKAEKTYDRDQLLFKRTVQYVARNTNDFSDGTDYLIRHTNTRTTHLKRPMEGFNNDGKHPYPGITSDTCNISSKVKGKNILLIDDVYTKTVNIDEDAIQALLDNDAESVSFYAIAKAVKKSTKSLVVIL